MDIKELDKKQLILLTLLITFVVSIATGIVTVSLMNQMPKSVPQTINNVIQRTIEKVSTVEVPSITKDDKTTTETGTTGSLVLGGADVLIPIYTEVTDTTNLTSKTIDAKTPVTEPVSIGQGVIVSDVGLILVDSSILSSGDLYKVVLNKTLFNASILKKFSNGFTILKISEIKPKSTEPTTPAVKTQ